ncbi:TniQ family protein [Deinococcus sp.]|uniref:TniQ family protein n=1 Tax=Deinococcus sp. TaxID=47478 RepID=UPI0025D29514|nr:TniQ family protein [Deinococcus sp.]
MVKLRPFPVLSPQRVVQGPSRLGGARSALLPMRPRPEPQELLSSWLFRLAQANSQKLHSLSRLIFGERQLWNRDIDSMAGDEVLAALERATGVNADVLRLHTLPSLEGRVYAHHTANSSTPWVLHLGIYHRTRRHCGLQYCPQCLGERPAYLLPWRLSISVVCPVHGCVLHAACPACGVPVVPHRVDMAAHLSKSFPTRFPHTRCHACEVALASAPTVAAPAAVVAWQAVIHAAIAGDGWVQVQGVGAVPLTEYLVVARLWLTLLTFGRRAERLRTLLGMPVLAQSEPRVRSFDVLDVRTRLAAIEHLITLFDGWPERVTAWSRAARLRRTILLQDMQAPPEWYLDALKPLEYVNPRRPLTGPLSWEELLSHAQQGGRRARLLVAYGEGRPVREVARHFGIAPRTVRDLVTRFNQGRPEGPARKTSSFE